MQSSHDAYSLKYYKNIGPEKCKSLCHDYFKDLMKEEGSLIHVATHQGMPVGMIVAHFRTRPPVYETTQIVEIEVAVVHPTFRHRGIFRRLLGSVEEKARLARVDMIEIIVDHDNTAGLAYEKTGFTVRQDKMVRWF